MPRLVFLWTDVLIWLLVVLITLFVLQARKSAQIREAWRRVAQSRTALSAAVVLGAYVLVGLTDSIHFNPQLEAAPNGEKVYAAEVLSLFDILATGLREVRTEKTYSAPLATHAYVKETFERPDGSKVRDFPRLLHGGAHLADPQSEWLGDVMGTGVQGALLGSLIWLALLCLIALLKVWQAGGAFVERLRQLLGGATELPWHAALWTLFVLFVLGGAVVSLSADYHVLGTDKVGQDVLYQAVKSIRTGLVIGTLTTLVMLPAAILLGIMAGYFRGWVDDVIQYLYTTLNSIPSVLLIAAAVLLMHLYMNTHADQFNNAERADLRLLFLCMILGITSWTGLCRLLRGETFKLRELEYVQAAQAMGVGHFTVLYRHVLPNVMHIVLITVVLDFSGLVLAEAVLSYINIGVDPSTESWGNMINGARLELAREPVVWWSLIAAFVFMFTLVLAANLFADRVRDAFDPRLRSVR